MLFGMCSMSIIWAFAYRLALLKNKEKLLNSPLGITIILITQTCYEGIYYFYLISYYWYIFSADFNFVFIVGKKSK